MGKITTVLICEDCNTEQQSIGNAWREGEEGEAIITLNYARSYSGPDSFFLANITPVDESEFLKKHEHLMDAANLLINKNR